MRKHPTDIRLKTILKVKLKFDYHNLKFDSGQSNLDIIFCRNVLIYFDEAAQKNVIDRFWDSMNRHSYLVIGHSESLFGMETEFKFKKPTGQPFILKFQTDHFKDTGSENRKN